LLIYSFVWPGMDPESFAERRQPAPDSGVRFVRGLLCFYLGLALILVASLAPIDEGMRDWVGIGGLLTTVHFGISNLLTASLQMFGWQVRPLFNRPLASRTLNDFWSSRWNLAFVEMNRRLFMPGLVKRFGMRAAVVLAFGVSGVLHELALSYPAGGGWGGPMLYFSLHALLVMVERRVPRAHRRWIAWAAILLPIGLLFHAPFRATFIRPLFTELGRYMDQWSTHDYLGLALWVAAGLHLLILAASFQVPSRLNWREELARLSPFNQKLMWTYGLFIVLCIISFSVLTFAFHGDFVRGAPLAIGVAFFVGVFWLLRVLIDCFYFEHKDWPVGPQFVAGHALLTSLFSFLVATYGAVVVCGLLA